MPRAAAKRYKGERFAHRSSLRGVRTIMIFFVTVAAFSTAALGFYQYTNESDYFRVKTIQIDGAHLLKAADIVAASGVSNEDNILFVSAAAVEDRVRTIPYVKRCEVTRTFPDLVKINVEERFPAATLLAHSHSYEIDADMAVLRRLPSGAKHTGPLISQVADIGAVEPGMQLTQAPLRAALQIWQAFSQTAMARDVTVSEISAAGANEIRMYCDELPFEIRWGRDNVQLQARNLDIVWQQRGPDLSCSEYLDLRFGQDLACK